MTKWPKMLASRRSHFTFSISAWILRSLSVTCAKHAASWDVTEIPRKSRTCQASVLFTGVRFNQCCFKTRLAYSVELRYPPARVSVSTFHVLAALTHPAEARGTLNSSEPLGMWHTYGDKPQLVNQQSISHRRRVRLNMSPTCWHLKRDTTRHSGDTQH